MDGVSDTLLLITEHEVAAAWNALRGEVTVGSTIAAMVRLRSNQLSPPSSSLKGTADQLRARMALAAVLTGAQETRAGAHVSDDELQARLTELTERLFARALASYVVWCGHREFLDSSLVAQALPTVRSFSEERAILRELAADRNTFFGWIPRDICTLIDALLHVRAGQQPGRVGERLEFGGVILDQEDEGSSDPERVPVGCRATLTVSVTRHGCAQGCAATTACGFLTRRR